MPPVRCPFHRSSPGVGPAGLRPGTSLRLLAQLLLVIAAVEFVVMGLLQWFTLRSAWVENLLDSLLLAVLATPPLWWIVRDTARRLDATERERLSARTATILEAAVDGIIVVDARGRILSFNHGAEQIFGYTAAEITGRPVARLVPDHLVGAHSRHLQTFAEGELHARPMQGRSILPGRRKDGTTVPVEISLAKSGAGPDLAMVAVVRDVSERTRIEAELRTAKEQAEAGTRAKSEFLANMSHEIRTPLNAVLGLSDLLALTPLAPVQRDYLATIRQGGDSLLTLLNDILDYSKIEAGRLEFEQRSFDLRHCVGTALELFAASAGKKQLDLAVCVDPDVPQAVIGDVTRVRQLLVNLVGNAVKFTAQGEVVVHVRRLGASGGRATLRFTVRDTGIGIPPGKADRLFKAFSQVDSSTSRHFGGTGLGLAICHRLVSLMGGKIWTEPNPAGGSLFSFTLGFPIDRTAGTVAPATLDALAGQRVLVVDDNETNRLILRHHLEAAGALVAVVDSGAFALRYLASDPLPRLIVIDWHMPGMDGVQLARQLRAQERTAAIPLLLVSSSGPDLPSHAEGVFSAVVPKPIHAIPLHRGIATALGTPMPAEPAATPQEPVRGTGEPPLRLLLVEDNAINQKVALGMLHQLGCPADLASHGAEAVDAARRAPYDVILMDVQMPVLGGIEATRTLRTLLAGGPQPYIIALTASALVADRAACRAAGMDDFLAKPLRSSDLRAALQRAHAHLAAPPQSAAPGNPRSADRPEPAR